jgi:hypothetical protein
MEATYPCITFPPSLPKIRTSELVVMFVPRTQGLGIVLEIYWDALRWAS